MLFCCFHGNSAPYLQRPRSRLLSLAVLARFTQAGLSGLAAGGAGELFFTWLDAAAAFFGLLLLVPPPPPASFSSHAASCCFLFFLAVSEDFLLPPPDCTRLWGFLFFGDWVLAWGSHKCIQSLLLISVEPLKSCTLRFIRVLKCKIKVPRHRCFAVTHRIVSNSYLSQTHAEGNEPADFLSQSSGLLFSSSGGFRRSDRLTLHSSYIYLKGVQFQKWDSIS